MRVIALVLFFLLIPDLSQSQSIPENAHKKRFGSGWSCNRGYYKSGGQCLVVQIPENGQLNFSGHGWDCKRGYYQSRGQCLVVQIPENGQLNFSGHGWDCMTGFKRSANNCVAMNPEEIKRQEKIAETLRKEIEKRKLRGVSGDDCDTEYKTGAEVCVEITGGNLDCNENFTGNYYDDCDVSLSYEVSTDYKGGNYLDTEIECKVEIEYGGREFYFTQGDSGRRDENHSLYAHGSDSNTMRFNFSFGYLDKVTSAEIVTTKCEVERVDLY